MSDDEEDLEHLLGVRSGQEHPVVPPLQMQVEEQIQRERGDAQNFEEADPESASGPPLRRRLLEALTQGPATPTRLATLTGAEKPSVSRVLASMLNDELVEVGSVEGDGRLRAYRLTREGEVRLRKQRVFGGPPEPPRSPTSAERSRFLNASIRNAVNLRREANDLEGAGDRLELVLQRTRKLGMPELELEAMAELATTLRQERNLGEMHALLGSLQAISLGRHSSGDPALALPATAHREYTLGRLPERHGGSSPRVRAGHLGAAQALFAELADSASPEREAKWRSREAWSIASLAANLRERSQLEEAVAATISAMLLFDQLSDPYGRSHCLFMLGFCQRLMGNFDEAWLRLREAEGLASEHSYQRFEADSLMQMGEVRRCQGEIAEARELLGEAFERARRMDLVVTQAFAQSSLGAVAYEEERLHEAQAALQAADELFERAGHSVGHALNDRRRSSVERRIEVLAGRSELAVARRFALKGLERYRALRSPAGMAACEIETGRLELATRGGRVDLQVDSLIERLDDTRQLNLFELDPWFPKMLVSFAEDVGNAELGERAKGLVRDGQRRLAEWASSSVGGQVADGGVRFVSMLRPRRSAGSDMGAETLQEEKAMPRPARV
jgi:tetratricopeptide (TPR) repeat protein